MAENCSIYYNLLGIVCARVYNAYCVGVVYCAFEWELGVVHNIAKYIYVCLAELMWRKLRTRHTRSGKKLMRLGGGLWRSVLIFFFALTQPNIYQLYIKTIRIWIMRS